MNICFISYDYPDERRSVFTFVKQLVEEIARQGNVCQVVAPYSITNNKRFHKYKEIHHIGQGKVIIYRPNYVSFSNLKVFGCVVTLFMQQKVINYALNHLDIKPDVVYGHFWQYGLFGFKYAQKENIPLFVASGESKINLKDTEIKDKKFFDYVSGVICVSSKNKDESIANGLTTESKCIVIPNAVNGEKFYKMNKSVCRQKLGLKDKDFVVVFVGSFNERKGVLRVSEALKRINDSSIKAIFIGDGEQTPDYKNIIYKGKLQHEQISFYLNAADVFVLPTRAEGCCNAVIEAMSCGLPIISSNLPFNMDILNSNNSILVDPNNIKEIASAIEHLKGSINLRLQMGRESLNSAQILRIDKRAFSVLSFIKKTI